jgi:hypothetical protein
VEGAISSTTGAGQLLPVGHATAYRSHPQSSRIQSRDSII